MAESSQKDTLEWDQDSDRTGMILEGTVAAGTIVAYGATSLLFRKPTAPEL